MEAYIFDIALVLIAIVIIVFEAKRGFALSLLSTFSVGISAFLSYKFSKPVSEFIYSSFLYGKIQENVTNAIIGLADDISNSERLSALTGALPSGLVKASQGLGFDVDYALSTLDLNQLSHENIVNSFIDNVACNVFMSVLEVVVFILLFIILGIALRYASLLFNKIIKKIPIVGKANTILGGVLGVVKAAISVIIIFIVACPIVFAIDVPWLEELISQSMAYQFIIENNPINNWM